MFKQALILAAVIAIAISEAPLSGPYPASGWKPSGAPFTLPKEFLPNPHAGDADIQVSKENVQFAGQLVETTTGSNAYLPPDQPEEGDDASTEDILKVQGLPSSERRPFNPRAQSGQLNQGEYNAPSAAERGQYRDQDTQKFGQFRQQNQQQQFVQNRQTSRQFGNNQAEQFGQLNSEPQQPQQFNPQPQQPRKFRPQPRQFNPQPQQFNQQPQQFSPQPQQQPQQFYQQPQQFSPQPQQFNQQPQQFNQQPQQFNPQQQQFNQRPQQFSPQPQPQFNQQPQVFSPVPQQPQVFNVQQPQQPQGVPATKYGPPNPNPKSDAEDDEADDTTDSGEDSNEGTQPNVAVANSISKGQYYILTPDNTLQRVAFTATQDQNEARSNGFTAQLRYMPVEPIRDPIYAFNDQGQLVRIFKK